MTKENPFKKGDIISHFKRHMYMAEKKGSKDYIENEYLYMYLGEATNTETKETMALYTAIYTDKSKSVTFGQQFVRPLDMFLSEVDRKKYPKEKYPEIKQKYRFELYQSVEDAMSLPNHDINSAQYAKHALNYVYGKTGMCKAKVSSIYGVMKNPLREYTDELYDESNMDGSEDK